MKHYRLSTICLAACAAGILAGCTPLNEPDTAAELLTTLPVETTETSATETTVTETVTTAAVTTTEAEKETTAAAVTTAATTAEPETTEAEVTTTTAAPEPLYDEDELQYLAMHYYGSRHNWIPQYIDVDKVEGNTVTLHLYDLNDGHTSTADWYYIDKTTGKGKNLLEEEIDLNEKPVKQWKPNVPERSQLPKDASCGIVYLGYVGNAYGRYSPVNAAFREYFSLNGYVDKYPYLANMPEENYAETYEGSELYLIIPRDDEAHVVVNAYDETNRLLGRIYSSYTGAPFLLRCNRSEIMSDFLIKITDNSGEYPEFSVYISGKDGKAKTDSARAVVLEPEE